MSKVAFQTAEANDKKGEDSAVSSVTWRRAFPHWDLIADFVPVAGSAPMSACSPELRTEIVMEAAAGFSNALQLAFGQLYPFVPGGLDVDLGREHGVQPYSSISKTTLLDAGLRSTQKRHLHLTLAQANVAAARTNRADWPENQILRGVGSALFGLSPEDFYLVVDVHLRGRDRAVADRYYFDAFGDTIDLALPQALAYAASAAHSTSLRRWMAELALAPEHWRSTHPQLAETLGILEFTLAEILEALYPDQAIRWDRLLD